MFKHILFRLACSALAITCCLANTEILNFRTVRNPVSGGFNGDAVTPRISLIPGQSHRASIPYTQLVALEHGENTATTIEYSVKLDDYLHGHTETGSWLCKTFVGGCSIDTEKAWTARISWPATTPASFDITVVDNKERQHGHDRTLRIDLRRTGVLIPPESALRIFNRRSNDTENQRSTISSEQTARAPPASTKQPTSFPDGPLIFDIVVEPLLFAGGVLPMVSWSTGVAVAGTLLVGPVVWVISSRRL